MAKERRPAGRYGTGQARHPGSTSHTARHRCPLPGAPSPASAHFCRQEQWLHRYAIRLWPSHLPGPCRATTLTRIRPPKQATSLCHLPLPICIHLAHPRATSLCHQPHPLPPSAATACYMVMSSASTAHRPLRTKTGYMVMSSPAPALPPAHPWKVTPGAKPGGPGRAPSPLERNQPPAYPPVRQRQKRTEQAHREGLLRERPSHTSPRDPAAGHPAEARLLCLQGYVSPAQAPSPAWALSRSNSPLHPATWLCHEPARRHASGGSLVATSLCHQALAPRACTGPTRPTSLCTMHAPGPVLSGASAGYMLMQHAHVPPRTRRDRLGYIVMQRRA